MLEMKKGNFAKNAEFYTMKICRTCKHWVTIPTEGYKREEQQMIEHGYRNCALDKDATAYARYLHGDAKGCGKHETEQKNA